jgi:4-amino-4-deoxy-L-arabinose transferase-like glycosyltransferase
MTRDLAALIPAPTSGGPASIESLETWLAAHRRRVATSVLTAAVLIRLLLCLQLVGGPLPTIHQGLAASDNHFFDAWGRRVAAGDLLQREPFHPMAPWMNRIARRALTDDRGLAARVGLPADADDAAAQHLLWDRWLGGATFYQEPGYPYLVGLTYALAGPRPWAVFAWQLSLGALGTLMVLQLGRRLFSETAGLAAGALAVLAPIPLAFDVMLLRDGLVATFTVALACLMAWTVEGGRRRWLLLGLAFGAAALLKTSLLAFPALLAVWRLVAYRTPWRERLACAALAGAGMALALSPAVLRNLVVGVPPIALNGSAAAMLGSFHTAEALPSQLVFGPQFAHVVAAADGHILASLSEAARTHASAWSLLSLELKRLAYAWHGFEAPNNVDFYVYRQGAPLLANLPATFVVLAPLAAFGLVGGRRHLVRAWPVILAALTSLPPLVLAGALSRYRAAFAAALLPLAGAGVARLIEWVRSRRWVPLGAALAATAAYLGWATAELPGRTRAERAQSYVDSANQLLKQDSSPALAALYFREALRLGLETPVVEARLGASLIASGNVEEGRRLLERSAGVLSPVEAHALQELVARLRVRAEAGAREEPTP